MACNLAASASRANAKIWNSAKPDTLALGKLSLASPLKSGEVIGTSRLVAAEQRVRHRPILIAMCIVAFGPVAAVATTVAIDQQEPSKASGNGCLIY